MRYCTMCGKEVLDQAVICPHCGCQIENISVVTSKDASSPGWAVVGFFLPTIGFVYGLAARKQFPKKAESALKGALVKVTLILIIMILFILFFKK